MDGRATRLSVALVTAVSVLAVPLAVCAAAAPARAEMQLSNLCFVDESYGWATAVSSDGYGSFCVARTTDGGATWRRQKSTAAFNGTGFDVQFVDRKRGIWVNSDVFVTQNGGVTWKRARFSRSFGYASFVDFATSSTAWVAGTYGSDGSGRCVARSTSGGKTWRTRLARARVVMAYPSGFSAPTARTAYLWSRGLWVTNNAGAKWVKVKIRTRFNRNAWWIIDFPTKKTGWALRYDRASLMRTKDGGRGWSKQIPGLNRRLVDLDFIDAQTGWVVGRSGAVYRTRDGGTMWDSLRIPAPEKLISVDFIDAQHGWVATDSEWGSWNTIYRTADGGETWEEVW